jgi:hypothetical protein
MEPSLTALGQTLGLIGICGLLLVRICGLRPATCGLVGICGLWPVACGLIALARTRLHLAYLPIRTRADEPAHALGGAPVRNREQHDGHGGRQPDNEKSE